MSETPGGLLIGHMASTAAVALVLTVIALINAETLGGATSAVSKTIASYSAQRMRESRLLRGYRESRLSTQPSTARPGSEIKESKEGDDTNLSSPYRDLTRNDKKLAHQYTHPKSPNKWHLWFWVVYVLVELPARRVATAYTSLKEGRRTLRGCLNVILGILMLPWCILVWILQVVVLNLADLFGVIKRKYLHCLKIWYYPC
jgi:hypothetical protein